jgi:hypothetical protein
MVAENGFVEFTLRLELQETGMAVGWAENVGSVSSEPNEGYTVADVRVGGDHKDGVVRGRGV